MKCQRNGCGKQAFWYPVLELRSPLSDVAATAEMPELFTCEDCRKITTIDDVLSDAGWSKILFTFGSTGRAKPDRSLTVLKFEPIQG